MCSDLEQVKQAIEESASVTPSKFRHFKSRRLFKRGAYLKFLKKINQFKKIFKDN